MSVWALTPTILRVGQRRSHIQCRHALLIFFLICFYFVICLDHFLILSRHQKSARPQDHLLSVRRFHAVTLLYFCYDQMASSPLVFALTAGSFFGVFAISSFFAFSSPRTDPFSSFSAASSRSFWRSTNFSPSSKIFSFES